MQLSNFDVEEVDGGRKREMVRGRQGENDQRGLAKEVVARMLIDQVVLQGGAFFGVGCNFKPSQWVSRWQRLRGSHLLAALSQGGRPAARSVL
jgi:hypothetical protein